MSVQKDMEITYDTAKNKANIAKHGIAFDRVGDFDFETALYVIDDRFDYGETRLRALGFIGSQLHALVFVETTKGVRVISLRKATKTERNLYAREFKI